MGPYFACGKVEGSLGIAIPCGYLHSLTLINSFQTLGRSAGKLTGDGFGRSLLTLKILTTEGKDKYCHYLQVKLGAI